MSRYSIWTRDGSVLGWSDPTFWHGSVPKVKRELAPAQTQGFRSLVWGAAIV